jgi:hypothetical protein
MEREPEIALGSHDGATAFSSRAPPDTGEEEGDVVLERCEGEQDAVLSARTCGS